MKRIFMVLIFLAILPLFYVIAQAQPAAKMPRIARLSPSTAAADEVVLAGFRQGLREHGWAIPPNVLARADRVIR